MMDLSNFVLTDLHARPNRTGKKNPAVGIPVNAGIGPNNCY